MTKIHEAAVIPMAGATDLTLLKPVESRTNQKLPAKLVIVNQTVNIALPRIQTPSTPASGILRS